VIHGGVEKLKLGGSFMQDTEKNIYKTVNELHDLFSKIDTSGKEYESIDLSYLNDEEGQKK